MTPEQLITEIDSLLRTALRDTPVNRKTAARWLRFTNDLLTSIHIVRMVLAPFNRSNK